MTYLQLQEAGTDGWNCVRCVGLGFLMQQPKIPTTTTTSGGSGTGTGSGGSSTCTSTSTATASATSATTTKKGRPPTSGSKSSCQSTVYEVTVSNLFLFYYFQFRP